MTLHYTSHLVDDAGSIATAAPTRPNWIDIDLPALDHNVDVIRSMIGPSVRIHACIKSSAYGCDVVEVAQRFIGAGADALCCGTYDEAVSVRKALPDVELIMFGSTLPDGIPAYLRDRLTPTIHNMELAEAVSTHSDGPVRVHVKVDAGWGRLGFPLSLAKESILAIARMPRIEVEAVYTHLPFTDIAGRDWAQLQTNIFCDLIEELRRAGLSVPVTQARASNGVAFGLTDTCNAVALGSILYGKASAPRALTDFSRLRPAWRKISSKLIDIMPDVPGKTVGRTTGTHGRPVPPFEGTTGVIPFGRRDGFAGSQAERTAYVVVRGRRAPVLAVNSELSVIDLRAIPDARIGDHVTILGRDGDELIQLDDLSNWQGCGQTDILVRMSDRLTRIFHR